MMDFISKLEELMPAVELNFEPTPGFGRFNRYLKHAVAHPAKMNTNLLEFLIKAYTKPGDTILDPMCGSGSTGVVAALHGRNAVQIDIEQKFIDWAEEAKRKVERSTKTEKGQILNICGDARKLGAILKEADVVLTSPPYSSLQQTGDSEETLKLWEERFGRSFGKGWKAKKYSEKPENIGNLPMGEINTILTSPPYAETKKGVANAEDWADRMEKFGSTEESRRERHTPGRLRAAKAMSEGYSQNKDNIGNLPFVDTILTSPPYGEAQQGSGIAKKGYQGSKHSPTDLVGKRTYMPDKFESSENISKLKYDAVITSPPYSESAIQDYGSSNKALLNFERQVRESFKKKEYFEYDGKKYSEEEWRKINKGELKPRGFSGIWAKILAERNEVRYEDENPNNIANLPHGSVDAVITSPPHGDSYLGGGDPEKRRERLIKAGHDPREFLGGEARNAVLKHYNEVDVVISSPPYSESMTKRRKGYTVFPELEMTREMPQDTRDDNIANLPHGNIAAIITSPPYERQHQGGCDSPKVRHGCIKERYQNTENIGNLPYVDTVITSPPYSEGVGHDSGDNASNEYKERLEMQRKYTRQMVSEGNIAKLKHGSMDAIITSPPYEASVSDGKESPLAGADEKKYGRWRKGTARKHSYTQHGEPCKVDTVITSPPYEGCLEGTSRHTRGGIASRDPALAQTGTYATRLSFGVPVGYSPNKSNIGNLKSTDEEYQNITSDLLTKNNKPTYLSEMFKVYSEMWKVLKPGGLAIVVVKPFIRQKKPVDLPYHTYLIMRRCGFVLEKLFKLRLKTESFWRVNYRYRCNHMGGKVGEQVKCKVHGFCSYESKEKREGCADYLPMSEIVATIAHEYVLVCQKSHPEMAVQHQPDIDHDEYALLSKLEEAQFRLAKKLAKKIKAG